MTSIIYQKELAERVIETIENTFSSEEKAEIKKSVGKLIRLNEDMAIVAGGMVRDHFFGNVAKDIDIFVKETELHIEPDITEQFLISSFVENDWEIEKIDTQLIRFMGYTPHTDVYKFNDKKGSEGNIILVDDLSWIEIISEFDCNLSKCYTHSGETVFHEDFVHGVLNETIEFKKYTTKENYLNKMLERFPTYKLRMI